MRRFVLAVLLLPLSARAAPLPVSLDVIHANPVRAASVPGATTRPARTAIGGCAQAGFVADEPLAELSFAQPVGKLEVEVSSPWALVLADGKVEGGSANVPRVLKRPVTGGAKLYAIGVDADGAGPSAGYRAGQRVAVRLEALEAARAYVLEGAPVVTVATSPAEPLVFGGARPTTGDEEIPNCGVFSLEPGLVLDVTTPIRAASLSLGFAREKKPVRIVGPLGGARESQQARCVNGERWRSRRTSSSKAVTPSSVRSPPRRRASRWS